MQYLLRAVRRRTWVCALALALGPAALWPVHGQRLAEYEVKAAFLFNFVKFVEWPAEALPAGGPLLICVLGDDPFGDALDAITKGERVGGHETAIRRFRSLDQVRSCQVLFVSLSERRQMPAVFEAVRGASVLTVSDIDRFAASGGMINFTKQNYRIGFEINPQAAERARLRISSKLLSLAKIVEGPGSP